MHLTAAVKWTHPGGSPWCGNGDTNSSRWPVHLPSPEKMNVDVIRRLTYVAQDKTISPCPIDQMDLVKINERCSHPLGPSLMAILKPSPSPSCCATTFAAYRRLPRISMCLSSACKQAQGCTTVSLDYFVISKCSELQLKTTFESLSHAINLGVISLLSIAQYRWCHIISHIIFSELKGKLLEELKPI
jgi:hypothetical protein